MYPRESIKIYEFSHSIGNEMHFVHDFIIGENLQAAKVYFECVRDLHESDFQIKEHFTLEGNIQSSCEENYYEYADKYGEAFEDFLTRSLENFCWQHDEFCRANILASVIEKNVWIPAYIDSLSTTEDLKAELKDIDNNSLGLVRYSIKEAESSKRSLDTILRERIAGKLHSEFDHMDNVDEVREGLIQKIKLDISDFDGLKATLDIRVSTPEELNIRQAIKLLRLYQQDLSKLKYDEAFTGLLQYKDYSLMRDSSHDICPDPGLEEHICELENVDRKNRAHAKQQIESGNLVYGIDQNRIRFVVMSKNDDLLRFNRFNTNRYYPYDYKKYEMCQYDFDKDCDDCGECDINLKSGESKCDFIKGKVCNFCESCSTVGSQYAPALGAPGQWQGD